MSYSNDDSSGSDDELVSKCPAFSLSNTNNALMNYATCDIYACNGETIYATLCAPSSTCNGDTYLRLYDYNGNELAYNDDICGFCSTIVYAVKSSGCSNFHLHEGCYGDSSCSGQVSVYVRSGSTSGDYSMDISDDDVNTCPAFTVSSTNDATVGYATCDIYACYGETIYATLCATTSTCNGDTYMRLYDYSGNELTYNDDACGVCSSIVYEVTSTGCSHFQLREGCWGDTGCSGQVTVYIYSDSTSGDYSMSMSSSYDYSSSGSYYSADDWMSSTSYITETPSEVPTELPSNNPTLVPNASPTFVPSVAPTDVPTSIPSPSPTAKPSSVSPTSVPSRSPTNRPTRRPSATPSVAPTGSTFAPTTIFDTLKATQHTNDCLATCSYPGMTVKPESWSETDYCAFYSSTGCDMSEVETYYGCNPSCLNACPDVFCDVFSSLTFTCTGTSGTYADKSNVESECLSSYAVDAPTETQIVFKAGLVFGDTDTATLSNDLNSQAAAIAAMSLAVSGVPENQISITDISDAARRSRHLSVLSQNRYKDVHVTGTGTQVTYSITAVLEQLGLTANDASIGYDSLVSQITTSVSTGQFVQNLKASGQVMNVSTFAYVSCDENTLAYTEYDRVAIRTAVPSLSPTNGPTSPSAAPTFVSHSQSSSSSSSLSSGSVAGISIAIIVLFCVAMVAVYYFYSKQKAAKMEQAFSSHDLFRLNTAPSSSSRQSSRASESNSVELNPINKYSSREPSKDIL
jgi:hypothetical protein